MNGYLRASDHNAMTAKRLIRKVWNWFDLYVLCMRSKVKYLRKRGAQIGQECDLLTDVESFGTEPYLVKIGDRVTITSGVKFITHDGSTRLFRRLYPEMNPYGNVFAPVIIGNNCFIGVNAILLPGTKIADDTIVGAGSVVKGEFPPRSVIAGVPAKRLSSLEDYITKTQRNMLTLEALNRTQLRKELVAIYFSQGNDS